MEELIVRDLSIVDFVRRLETEEGFSFARYGDGTFLALNGMEVRNCDGAMLSISQAEELEASIRDGTITHGIGDLALRVGAEKWLRQKGIEVEWYECNVMNTASHQGKLYPFIQWLRKRRVVMVGPKHLRKLKAFPVAGFVETHPTDAFGELEDLQLIVSYVIAREIADTVLISAGPAAPPLVSRIHNDFPYLNVIDTGSIWDLYVGVLSRKVHRKMNSKFIRDLGKQNFGADVDVSAWW